MIFQDLINSNHSWSDIQNYTLSEIGVFIKSIYRKKSAEKLEDLQLNWMAANLSDKGIKEVFKKMSKGMESKTKKGKKATKQETTNEWKRLASFRKIDG